MVFGRFDNCSSSLVGGLVVVLVMALMICPGVLSGQYLLGWVLLVSMMERAVVGSLCQSHVQHNNHYQGMEISLPV